MERTYLRDTIGLRIADHCARYGLDPAKYKWNPEWDNRLISWFNWYADHPCSLDDITKDIPTCIFNKLNLGSIQWIPMWSFTRIGAVPNDRKFPSTISYLDCINACTDSDLYGDTMYIRVISHGGRHHVLEIEYDGDEFHWIDIPRSS